MHKQLALVEKSLDTRAINPSAAGILKLNKPTHPTFEYMVWQIQCAAREGMHGLGTET